jgi:hypothetical protein
VVLAQGLLRKIQGLAEEGLGPGIVAYLLVQPSQVVQASDVVGVVLTR